jgi:hypothetical protein
VRRASTVGCLVLTGSWLLFAESASAQEGIFGNLQKSVDSIFSSVSTTITDASGAVTKTTTNSVNPKLTLTMDSLVYPALRLNAGGVFEVDKAYSRLFSPSDTPGETDSTITRFRPFVLLRSTNPVFSPGVGFFRREDRARVAGLPATTLVNDDYAAYLGWKPEGGPRSDFQFVRTNTFDNSRTVLDTTKGFGSLVSSYSYQNLSAYYRGTYLDSTDRLGGLETQQVSSAARVGYSGSFIDKRLLWNAMYNINDQSLRTKTSGKGGEVALPLIPNGGLAALSDTPVTTALTPNPLLVDGNLTAGVGINLGLTAPGTNAQARNVGLDFLNRTEVNRLLVWIDRELPADIAASFSWEVYSSPDNLVWTRESLVPVAPFGPFDNRFEVDFPSVTARYVKLVTRALSVVVPDASRFPDILVTEVQAFLRRPAGQVAGTLGRTTHTVNTDARMRLLDRPSLYYEGFYLYYGPDALGSKRDTLSNGVSVNHAFGRIFAVYGRGAFEEGTQPEGHRVATVTNATFTVTPIPTFRSSVLYTGQNERIDRIPNDRRGVFVQNTAQLYRGVDVLFGVGWNFTTRETGEISRDRLTNISATVVPRQHLSLTFSFDDTTTERSGTFVGTPSSHTRRGYATVAIDPLRTLHLVLGEELIAISGEKTRATHNIDVNWAPFPDGALQFVFAYDEALRELVFGKERSVIGAVRWNVSRRSFINVSYQRTRSEFVLYATESRVLSSDVRIFF